MQFIPYYTEVEIHLLYSIFQTEKYSRGQCYNGSSAGGSMPKTYIKQMASLPLTSSRDIPRTDNLTELLASYNRFYGFRVHYRLQRRIASITSLLTHNLQVIFHISKSLWYLLLPSRHSALPDIRVEEEPHKQSEVRCSKYHACSNGFIALVTVTSSSFEFKCVHIHNKRSYHLCNLWTKKHGFAWDIGTISDKKAPANFTCIMVIDMEIQRGIRNQRRIWSAK